MAGSFNVKEQGRLQGLGIFWGFFFWLFVVFGVIMT
jgi:hypothetical protein